MSPARVELTLGSDYPVLGAYMQDRPTSGARISTIIGPRASGKTFGSAQRALLHMSEQEPNERGIRPTRGMISRDSYTELMSTTVKDFMAVFADLGEFRQSSAGPPSWRSKPGLFLPDGSQIDAEVIFQSAGVDDAAERVKGYQLTWAWFNELSGIDRSVFSTTRQALGRYPSPAAGGVPCTWHGTLSDTNSFDESHWLFSIVSNPPPGWNWFRQPGAVRDTGRVGVTGRKVWEANPEAENLAWIVGGSQWYLDLCQGETDDRIKVLLANEFGFFVDGKPVHPQYVDSVHCAPEEFEPDRRYPIVLGLDWGRTPAAAFLQHWDAAGRWVCFDEMTTENMSAALFAPELKHYIDRRYPGFAVTAYGDPAGDRSGQTVETTPIQIVRAQGIPCFPAPSNVTTLRRAALVNPMRRLCMDGRPAFLLSPRCKMIRKGLGGGFCYRKLKVAGEIYSEEVEKNQWSHPVEALEYGLEGAGEGRAALLPAESQLRHHGPIQVTAITEWSDGEWR